MKNFYSRLLSLSLFIVAHLIILPEGIGQALWSGTMQFDPSLDGGTITDAGDAGSYTGSSTSASYTIAGHTFTGSSSNAEGVGIEDFEPYYTGRHNMMWLGVGGVNDEFYTLRFSANEIFDISQLIFLSTSDASLDYQYTIEGYLGANVIHTLTTPPLIFDDPTTIVLNFTGIDRLVVRRATATTNGITFQVDDLVFNNVGQTILPVTLVSFNALASGQDARLSWEAADATNFSHFIVERSADGDRFEETGSVSYLESQRQYSFADLNVATRYRRLYYRLKMQDINGTYKYSRIVIVNFTGSSIVTEIYPNPVRHELRISFTDPNIKRAAVRLFSMDGRLVMQKDLPVTNGISWLRFDKTITPNQYFLSIETDAGRITRKVLKE